MSTGIKMTKKIRINYRIARRIGYGRGEPALRYAVAVVKRLEAAFAVMEATQWQANPVSVVAAVHSRQI